MESTPRAAYHISWPVTRARPARIEVSGVRSSCELVARNSSSRAERLGLGVLPDEVLLDLFRSSMSVLEPSTSTHLRSRHALRGARELPAIDAVAVAEAALELKRLAVSIECCQRRAALSASSGCVKVHGVELQTFSQVRPVNFVNEGDVVDISSASR